MKKESEKLGVLISTYGKGMNSVVSTVLPTIDLSSAVVIINHQRSDLYDGLIPEDDSIIYQVSNSEGLSKSRNECLELIPCEVNVIADDDVKYQPGFETAVLKAFEDTGADILTFQTVEGIPRTKNVTEHNWLSLLRVKSIEITFRKSVIQQARILFDEDFGLGAEHETGEENIFLEDCRKTGLELIDHPAQIVSHPHPTSGESLGKEMMKAKRKMFVRMLGVFFGSIVFVAFYLKKFLNKF
jgi:hypothetical protein